MLVGNRRADRTLTSRWTHWLACAARRRIDTSSTFNIQRLCDTKNGVRIVRQCFLSRCAFFMYLIFVYQFNCCVIPTSNWRKIPNIIVFYRIHFVCCVSVVNRVNRKQINKSCATAEANRRRSNDRRKKRKRPTENTQNKIVLFHAFVSDDFFLMRIKKI